ncbi:het-s domain protein [Diplodia corticola]|uniref:Het-s domain protein n=1 Tax=Diplodia corticola TaxID=236234 RepID=A0A1J9RZ88_9PEZI|nr:het-s domain protein [Diplodia corticola]OJD33663.1 het-s domain protein [Diplodia corticola]
MDPLSITVSTVSLFKEVLLVSRFIYRKMESAKDAQSEKDDLCAQFELEVLFLQSLGHVFQGGITKNQAIDTRWMNFLHRTLERMNDACSAYRTLAAEKDADYQKYSPFLNSTEHNTKIDFDVDAPLSSKKRFSIGQLLGAGGKVKDDPKWDWKWAFIGKRKFESLIREFQRLNGRLKDILPLAIAHMSPSRPDEKSAARLGLKPHYHLRSLASQQPAGVGSFLLKDKMLEVDETGPSVVVGLLSRTKKKTAGLDAVLVEYKEYAPEQSSDRQLSLHKEGLAHLATLLKSAGECDLATLPFKGIMEQDRQHRHAFIFGFPKGTDDSVPPLSLNFMISEGKNEDRLDLDQRFAVAQRLAKSMGVLHADGWVHKSIRSESILFFRSRDGRSLLIHTPYVTNFEFSRPEGQYTGEQHFVEDEDWQRNLYRHPERQGMPTSSFRKEHDIYALGIILLEIGLWEEAASIYRHQREKAPNAQLRPTHLQNIFLKSAKSRLAHHMGTRYLEAVLACIDGEFDGAAAEADFPMIFYEKVTEKLERPFDS